MKTLTLENWKELQPYIEAADYHEYNSNAITMLMWSGLYEIHFETQPHYAIAYSIMPNHAPIWLMPFCEKQYRKEAIEAIRQYSQEHDLPFEIHSMIKEFKDWLQQTYPLQFLVWDCYDARDYVYDRQQQETLSGKKMQKRRNHYNAFIKQYEGRYRYEPLANKHRNDIYQLLREWQSSKESSESITTEDTGIHLLLEHMDELPLKGGCIYIDDELKAFSIASCLAKDTIQIHVEKADRNIRGLYIAILKLFLETLEEDIRYINREDDMGLEKLRKAKSDMQPICKIQKFGSCYQPLHLHTANDTWLPQIRTLWQQRFQEETKESTDFFFANLYQEEHCYLLTSQDELISMLQLRWMDIMVDQKPCRVPFVIGVATQSDCEGCGYMKLLLEHVMRIAAKKTPYMLLQAYNWDIYKGFGFQEVFHRGRWKLKKDAYTTVTGIFKNEGDPSLLASLYTIYTKNKNGYRLRDEKYYRDQFLPYAQIWNQEVLTYYENETAKGYLVCDQIEDTLYVRECIYIDQESLTGMLTTLAQRPEKIYVDLDEAVEIEGRKKLETNMMVKCLQDMPFPDTSLFIHEEI